MVFPDQLVPRGPFARLKLSTIPVEGKEPETRVLVEVGGKGVFVKVLVAVGGSVLVGVGVLNDAR